jgi:NitT/TauT family transport system permease protein
MSAVQQSHTPVTIGRRRRWPASASARVLARRFLLPLAVPVVLLGGWQVVAPLWGSTILPTPSTVADAWWTWIAGPKQALGWNSGTWLDYVWMSTKRVAIGFSIAAAAGIVVGIFIGWYAVIRVLVDPIINFMRAVPMTAWLPFTVFFFGIHESAAIFLIALGAFFPIVVNTASGAAQSPKHLIRAALMLGTPPRRLLLRVVLPSALPSIFTGLRVGVGLAWVLVIVAEMLAVQGGVGYALWTAYQFGRLDLIVASIITVGTVGLLSDRLLATIGRYLTRWQTGL